MNATPKPEKVRSLRLLQAVRDLPCQFDLFGRLCRRQDGTVVACHSNWAAYGDKGRATKADDRYIAAGCYRCHSELDQGKRMSREERQRAWLRAHTRTVDLMVRKGMWPASLPLPQ